MLHANMLRATYPVQFDEDAGLASVVTIETIHSPRAVLQHGPIKLAGAFGIVPDLQSEAEGVNLIQRDPDRQTDSWRDRQLVYLSTVLLNEVFIWRAVIISLNLITVIVGCRQTGHRGTCQA